MTFSLTMFRILTHGHVNATFMDHRSGNNIVTRSTTTKFPDRGLRVGIKFPEQLGTSIFAGIRAKAVNPTITTRENRLRNSIQDTYRWR